MLKHPLSMKTVFRRCLLVNFAIDKKVLQALLPEGIEADLHEGKAFLSIVIADMEKMRPSFLPWIFGISYNQIVYRAVVRVNGERGVYFLRSDADNRFMSMMVNWLTFFRFHYSKMKWNRDGDVMPFRLKSAPLGQADIEAQFHLEKGQDRLPRTSRFASLSEAKTFLVELYSAFAVDAKGRPTRVRIERSDWDLRLVSDEKAVYRFMQGGGPFPLGSAEIDSCFYVEDLPYYWYRLEKRDL